MIYVIVKEEGEYSDYRMELLYAYTNKETAEEKLKSLEKVLARTNPAQKELQDFYADFNTNNPYPLSITTSRRYWDNIDHTEYNLKIAERNNKFSLARATKLLELTKKFDITEEQLLYWGSDEVEISIQAVEGY